jgi:DNA invertase Pin-like site-specific DNA recombinase
MKQAVSYLRVSTNRQGESGLGLTAQQGAVAQMAQELGVKITKELCEIESGKSRKRPKLDEALEYCKVTGALLLVPKMDRLARDATYLMALYDSGVDIHFGDLPDASGSSGRLMLQVMASIAEYEGRRISERTKAALAVAKARGQKLGGYRGAPPPDWKEGIRARQKKADAWAQTLCGTIRKLEATGHTTLTGLAGKLTEMGARTPRGNTHWQPVQVRRVLDRCDVLGF